MSEKTGAAGDQPFDEGDGYPEEGPPGANEGAATPPESEARKGSQDEGSADDAPQQEDRTATGNPRSAGA